MPYLSDAEIAELSRGDQRGGELAVVSGDDSVGTSALAAAGSMGSAALVGLIRSKLENPATGEWFVPGTRWDMEGVLFMALAGVAVGGKYLGLEGARSYAALGAIGVGSHYLGEVARRFGRTGKLDFQSVGVEMPWHSEPNAATAPHSVLQQNAAQAA